MCDDQDYLQLFNLRFKFAHLLSSEQFKWKQILFQSNKYHFKLKHEGNKESRHERINLRWYYLTTFFITWKGFDNSGNFKLFLNLNDFVSVTFPNLVAIPLTSFINFNVILLFEMVKRIGDGKRIENDDDELNNNHLTLHTSEVMKKEKI